MALLKVICWAIIFITRLRFPPGKSLASNLYFGCYIFQEVTFDILSFTAPAPFKKKQIW